jgi:hypothetical protein
MPGPPSGLVHRWVGRGRGALRVVRDPAGGEQPDHCEERQHGERRLQAFHPRVAVHVDGGFGDRRGRGGLVQRLLQIEVINNWPAARVSSTELALPVAGLAGASALMATSVTDPVVRSKPMVRRRGARGLIPDG